MLTSLGTGEGRTRAWHSGSEGPASLPRTRPVSHWWLRGVGVVPFRCLKSPSCPCCVGSWFEVPSFLVGLSRLSRFPGCSPEWTLRCLRSLKQIPDHAAPSAAVIEGGGQWTQGSPCPLLSRVGLCGALTDGVALGTSQVVGHPGSWPKAVGLQQYESRLLLNGFDDVRFLVSAQPWGRPLPHPRPHWRWKLYVDLCPRKRGRAAGRGGGAALSALLWAHPVGRTLCKFTSEKQCP